MLAESASVILFTRRLHSAEVAELGTTHGYAGTAFGAQPVEGLRVLLQLLAEPSFSAPILLPPLVLYFVFIWLAALLGSSRWVRPA
jgi:hypothetical protein